MNAKESPIFIKLFDFVSWVLPLTAKFPREQRFILAERLQRVTLAAHEAAIKAGMSKTPEATLARLDKVAVQLALVRFYLRLARKQFLITDRQLEFATERLAEIGRLLRGWQKSLQGNDTLNKQAIPGAASR